MNESSAAAVTAAVVVVVAFVPLHRTRQCARLYTRYEPDDCIVKIVLRRSSRRSFALPHYNKHNQMFLIYSANEQKTAHTHTIYKWEKCIFIIIITIIITECWFGVVIVFAAAIVHDVHFFFTAFSTCSCNNILIPLVALCSDYISLYSLD